MTNPPPHPDDERLSAALDGHDADAAAHAARCTACGDRMAGLAAAAAALAAPTRAVDDAVRERHIAAALDRVGEVPVGGVVPLRRRPSSRFMAVAAAAAAVAVAVAAGSIIGRDNGRTAGVALEDAGGRALSEVELSGDLGDVGDDQALRAALEAGLDGETATMAAPAADAAADDATSSAGAPAGGSGGTASAMQMAGPAACVEAADELGGDAHGPVLRAFSLRYQGTPATAIVFEMDGGDDDGRLARRVYVMADGDCRLLVVQSF